MTDFTPTDIPAFGRARSDVLDANFTAIQNAIASKLNSDSPALTGIPTAPTANVGTGGTQIATCGFVSATAFASTLPAQTGNAGKFVTTDGVNASWVATENVKGGSTTTSSATDITLTAASTRVQLVTMTATDKSVILPDATTLSEGGPLFVLRNEGTYAFFIKNSSGVVLYGLEPGEMVSLYLSNNSTAAGSWNAEGDYGANVSLAEYYASTVYTATTAGPENGNASVSQLDTDKCVVAFQDSTDSSYGNVQILTQSGVTISAGTKVRFSGTVVASGLSVAKLSTTSFVISYRNATDTYIYAVACTVSGTTITVGTPVKLSGTAGGASTSVLATSTTSGLCVYGDTTNNRVAAVAFTVSGTTITAGSVVATGMTGYSIPYITLHSSALVVVSCTIGATTYLVALSISGTTVTAGALITKSNSFGQCVNTSATEGYWIANTSTTANHAQVLIYRYSISGTTITVATEFQTMECDRFAQTPVVLALSASRLMVYAQPKSSYGNTGLRVCSAAFITLNAGQTYGHSITQVKRIKRVPDSANVYIGGVSDHMLAPFSSSTLCVLAQGGIANLVAYQ